MLISKLRQANQPSHRSPHAEDENVSGLVVGGFPLAAELFRDLERVRREPARTIQVDRLHVNLRVRLVKPLKPKLTGKLS